MAVKKSILCCTLLLVAAGGFVCLSGCGRQGPQPPTAGEAQAHSHDGHDHDHAHETGRDEIAAELAKLTPEDRALAEQQKICVVAGEPLGSMGTPVKLTVAGRDVFICCAACEDSLREEPEKYLSKLEEQAN